MSDRAAGSLTRVVKNTVSQTIDPTWFDTSRVVEVRDQVSDLLASENAPAVYGFNRLLGEMDDSAYVASDAQEAIYQKHLVGSPVKVSADFVRLMSYCKIQQLVHGGNGISPDTYERLVNITDYSSAVGSWNSSYGAGDVVPGTWWARAVLSDDDVSTKEFGNSGITWVPGDLIALISGNFVSTAWGVSALLKYLDVAAGFIARYGSLAVLRKDQLPLRTFGDDAIAVHHELSAHFQPYQRTGVQLPVSLRDGTSTVMMVIESIQALAAALDARLSCCSGNPVFISNEENEYIENVSQNSYLDHRLTTAATSAIQNTMMMTGLLQRTAAHAAARGKREAGAEAKIQHPKTITALLIRQTMSHAMMPAVFTGNESEGVEDFWDLSLLTSEQLASSIKETEKGFDIFDETTHAPDESAVNEIRGVLYRLAFGAENGEEIATGSSALELP